VRDLTTDRIVWKVAGEAGAGIKTTGQIFSRMFARGGYHVFDYVEYPSLIRGGHNVFTARVDKNPFFSPVKEVDVLVALNEESIDLHADDMRAGGTILYDAEKTGYDLSKLAGKDVCTCDLPMARLAKETAGSTLMMNSVALGATVGMVGFDFAILAEVLRDTYERKGEKVVERNVAAARAGYDHVRAECMACGHELTGVEGAQPERLVIDGNEAVGMGMIAAGCTLYAAYPMTPASGLLHFMAENEAEFDVVVKHTEDEIAAINMVIGAVFAGARAMCATSGGGFSLMVEGLGLAGVSESPIVVGVFGRPGPATGMPTWTEQGDLLFVIHASQGEFPRIVLSPGDKLECFEYATLAFNLAEIAQLPVILLSDMFLQESHSTVEQFDLSQVRIDRGKLVRDPKKIPRDGDDYLRYKITDDGISPRVLPGMGATMLVNSYEHDEYGWATEGAEMRAAMMDKRARKLEAVAELLPKPKLHGPSKADITLIGWGSQTAPLLEAMCWLEAEGRSVNFLQLTTMHPFPAARVLQVMQSAGTTVCVENNMGGQLAELIREHCLVEVDYRLNKYDGRQFFPEEIAEYVREVVRVGGRRAEAI